MTVQSPIPDFAAAREAMVESQLRPQGVTDAGVLKAMGVDRARAFPARRKPGRLLMSTARVAIGDGRFLAAPAVLGQLLTQMVPKAGERALVVGAGTGYSAAVLSAIGLKVAALESSAELAKAARDQQGEGRRRTARRTGSRTARPMTTS